MSAEPMTDEEILALDTYACCVHCDHDPGTPHLAPCEQGCNDA